ncbi:MAG TPA: nucleoside kinase [Candidatus Cloacimonadota bacterium]|nr:nucleoside kinase [Candidatus Cloacimonadota bacterium]HQB41384.1 nucleoside kinase [Candidatus Cloacimonadota bacterium]
MISVDITYESKQIKCLSYAKAITINEIMDEVSLPFCKIVAYKINNEYATGAKLLEQNTRIEVVPLTTTEGYRIYQDSIIFLFHMAFYLLYGTKYTVNVQHSIGDGVYCELENTQEKVEESDLKTITQKMKEIIDMKAPIQKINMPIDEALNYFNIFKRFDIIKNLNYCNIRTIDVFNCREFYDYYPSDLVPHTGLLDIFELCKYGNGFVIRFPKNGTCEIDGKFEMPKILFSMHQEHDKWLNILKVHNIGDLNELIENCKISDFIQTEEALHEKKIAFLADQVFARKQTRVILIAGPSSSGKTTFAKRLSVQLRVNGITPLVIGLDDYFLPRTQTPRKADGDYDFESIYSLDLDFLNRDLLALINGQEVVLPRYNFITGVRESSGEKLALKDDNVLVLEGIHAINDVLTSEIPNENKMKIYISALNQLNIDYHNRIATTDFRKLRRIARDFRYRGYSAEETLMRWDSIREGEDKNIFPFQENVDFMFNSSLTYELGVLKKHVLPQLHSIQKHSNVYNIAQNLITLLGHIRDIQDNLVPLNSILREFTFESVFKY